MTETAKAMHSFFSALASVQERLKGFEESISERPGVLNSTLYRFTPRSMKFSGSQSGSEELRNGDDFGVSATLTNGTLIDWWLEVWLSQSSYHLSANVHLREPQDETSQVLHEVLESSSTDLIDFLASLHMATERLIAAEVKCLE